MIKKSISITFLFMFVACSPYIRNNSQPLSDSLNRMDTIALNTPDSVETSIQSLAMYLGKTAKSDSDKARALYRWMAENIYYNVNPTVSSFHSNVSANDVLRTRKAVCGGYAGLYKSLADIIGLKVVEINGWAKGVNYSSGASFEGKTTNHAWIAVQIDSTWHLIDPTWGAGYMNNGKYIHKFNDYYFLTLPEELIYSHFPKDQQWQLLSRKVTLDEFEKSIYVKWTFFELGMQALTHKECTFHADKQDTMKFYIPDDVQCKVRLSFEDDDISEQNISIEYNNNTLIIYLALPHKGVYNLSIFAKKEKAAKTFNLAAEYKVISD